MNYKIYLNKYHVYPNGTIYSIKNKKILKPAISGNHGYHFYRLCGKKVFAHRLMCECFLENPLGLPCINHRNGIKTDNRIQNLEYCSHRDNVNHMYQTGLRPTKLSAADVIHIRNHEMHVPQEQLAEKYGCTGVNISHVRTRKTWQHL